MTDSLLYPQESYAIVGAAMEVHRVVGMGFTEPVYQDALEIEFGLRGIPFEREKVLGLEYKGHPLDKTFRVDFVCYGNIVVELKALHGLGNEHVTQVYNYLKASGMTLGILINFGRERLAFDRIPCTHKW